MSWLAEDWPLLRPISASVIVTIGGSEILCGDDDVLHETATSRGGLRTQAGEDGGELHCALPELLMMRNSTEALRSALLLVVHGRPARSLLHNII